MHVYNYTSVCRSARPSTRASAPIPEDLQEGQQSMHSPRHYPAVQSQSSHASHSSEDQASWQLPPSSHPASSQFPSSFHPVSTQLSPSFHPAAAQLLKGGQEGAWMEGEEEEQGDEPWPWKLSGNCRFKDPGASGPCQCRILPHYKCTYRATCYQNCALCEQAVSVTGRALQQADFCIGAQGDCLFICAGCVHARSGEASGSGSAPQGSNEPATPPPWNTGASEDELSGTLNSIKCLQIYLIRMGATQHCLFPSDGLHWALPRPPWASLNSTMGHGGERR